MFTNLADAGEKLADALVKYENADVLALAVPRGGVIVAAPVVKRFGWDWDLIIARKIGAPQNPEVAIGAVSFDGTSYLNQEYVTKLGVTQEYIEKEAARQVKEIERRLQVYRGDRESPDLQGRTVIVIDDGIATGLTMLAAVKSIQNQRAARIVLAVPVGPEETIAEFEQLVDEVICLSTPEPFYAVGQAYENFDQVSDEEISMVIQELNELILFN